MAGSRSGEEAARMADGSPFPASDYLAAFARIAVTAKISLLDDEIVVIADLPGFDEDEIEIQFTDAGLQIEGIQEEGEEELSGTYLVRERPRSWTRTVYLPDTVEREDTSVESVEFKNGRLTIILQESRIADQRIKI